ncbi:MAG: NUDIX domain-containing protein [Pirellulales bacterium]
MSLRRGAVAVIVRQGRWLVIRRSPWVVAPRQYCFPGGGIEPGETEEAALCRELREELAVNVIPVARLWQSVTPWQVELSWWLSRLADGEEPQAQPQEVESVHWLEPDELTRLPDLLESNRAFLAAWERGEFQIEG